MPRSRVPIKGSIGKSILTGQKQTVVQQTIVQQVTKGATSGVGTVASTIWPLIQQIPTNIVDLAALATPGLVVDTGSHIIARTLAVNAPLTIANPTGAAGNPTVSLTTAALTKTDDTNVTLTLGGTPASALVEAVSLTLGWAGQLAVSRGGSGADSLTGYLVGNGTSPFTAVSDIPAADVSGLATVATTGSYTDLSDKPTIPADISALTYVTVGDETADAPNSSQLVAGTNITFDTSTPNQLKIDATGGGSSPLTTKGDLFGYDTTDARIPVGTDGQVLTADSTDPLGVSWQTASGGASGHNPTASVGLTAVNGTATTFLRSDGSPALDQGIAPTWSGSHAFEGLVNDSTGSSLMTLGIGGGVPLLQHVNSGGATDTKIWRLYATASALNGTAVNDAVSAEKAWLSVTRTGTAIQTIVLGNTSDNPAISLNGPLVGGIIRSPFLIATSIGQDAGFPAVAWNQSGGGTDSKIWEIYVDGSNWNLITVDDAVSASKNALTITRSGLTVTAISGYGPVAGALVDMTPDASSFTGTFTGVTGTVTNTCRWSRNGNQVTLTFGTAAGTGNVNTYTMTGLPAAIQPARTQLLAVPDGGFQNNVVVSPINGAVQVTNSGTVTFFIGGVNNGWSAVSTKSIINQFSVTYLLN